jgi:hypothetical protein
MLYIKRGHRLSSSGFDRIRINSETKPMSANYVNLTSTSVLFVTLLDTVIARNPDVYLDFYRDEAIWCVEKQRRDCFTAFAMTKQDGLFDCHCGEVKLLLG